jgi:hypothetical protein
MTDWILSQFASHKKEAQSAYQQFVMEGMKADPLWKDLRVRSILGEDDFAERLMDHIRGKERIAEIPKSQRFASRPPLHRLFGEQILQNQQEKYERIVEAIEQHGYTQKEIADHLGFHFSSISRILRTKRDTSRK